MRSRLGWQPIFPHQLCFRHDLLYLALFRKCGECRLWWQEELERSSGPVCPLTWLWFIAESLSIGGYEHSGYLTHLLRQYDKGLANVTLFLHGCPEHHLNFNFLRVVLRAVKFGTYAVAFLPLNGARLRKRWTPCLKGAYLRAFGANLTQPLQPYCCSQFAVSRDAILQNRWDSYDRMKRLVDGRSGTKDICSHPGATALALENFWHITFGELADPGWRQDDQRLPVAFRWEWYRQEIGEWEERLA